MSFVQRISAHAWRADAAALSPSKRIVSAIARAGNWLNHRARDRDAVVLLPECIAIVFCLSLIWISLWMPPAQERRDAEAAAVETTSNLARAFEENSERIISGIDEILLTARAAYADNEKDFDIVRWAAKRAHVDKFAFFIGRIDENGISRESSLGPAAAGINLSDRDHFRSHLDPARDDLFISKPVIGRASRGTAIQFTRKLLHADGRFAGVVQVSLNASELSRFYETIDLGNGYVMLAGADGVIRARGPLGEGIIGRTIGDPALLQAVQSRVQGSLWVNSRTSEGPRIVSFRKLTDYPMVVLISFDANDIYRNYWESRRHAALTGIVATAIVLLLGRFWMQHRRRWFSSKRALRVTLESISQGIVMIDAEGRMPVINPRAVELLDLPSELLAQSAIGGADESGRFLARDQLIQHKIAIPVTDPARLVDDREVAVFESVRSDGKIIEVQRNPIPSGGHVITYTDVTERKLAEARIRHLAHHDGLTGLPNRILLNERIAEAVNNAMRGGRDFAVLCLDLDGFKTVNDTMGHEAGDLLLSRLADRLRNLIRPIDTVARTGGDEFTIVQRNVDDQDDVGRLVQRLLDNLQDPVQVDGYRLGVACSIGVALYPRHGSEGRTLLKNADTALYRAKAEGRGTFRFFEPEMDRSLQERRALEHDLQLAIQHDRLEVYFQPEFACDSLKVVGFEALVRWRDPVRGVVPPGIFIPIAEECGLIDQLGRIVLERACALAASWQPKRRIAVNLSPRQFRDNSLPIILSEILKRTGLPAHLLELEVTEGVLIRDEEQALTILRGLKAQGVRIALDDFGTGYSSLSYLRRFPFDKIKIDKSFVQAQQYDPGAQAILETILAMSGRLNLSVTAEGVETEEQLAMIRRQRCTEVQGYLLGMPMPAAQVPGFLQTCDRDSAAWQGAGRQLDLVADAAD
jgi:diguanylate cyclase (GGDEF)-like protein